MPDSKNICKFMPSSEVECDITTLNFVYEKNWAEKNRIYQSSFMLALVTGGEGELTFFGKSYAIGEGDIFFVMSAKEYVLCNRGGLKFIYITFIGSRVHPLTERLRLDSDTPVLIGYSALIPFWLESIERAEKYNSDLVSQAVLYYTLSYIAADSAEKMSTMQKGDTMEEIKRYVDEHYTESELSLSSVACRFGYNPKYLSEKFRRTMRIGLNKYITELRMQCAVNLIREGRYSVAQAAESSGYSDPLYFSKVFKKHFGVSPRDYACADKK